MLDSTSGALFTSPRLRGEVGLRASAIRVRGAIREFDYAETAPHPNPLRGEVGLRASAIRVRGAIREFDYAETAPHPNPLPVKNGEREFLPAHAIFIA